MIRFALMILLIGNSLALEAQNGKAPPLTLEVAAGAKPESFRVVLRNTSKARVHVLLGYGDGRGNESLGAFSFHIIDSHSKRMDFEALGFPVAGTVKVIHKEIAPGEAWSGEIEWKSLLLKEHLENPTTADQLPAGSYTVQAIFQGESSRWPIGASPYWLGIVQSPSTQYVLSK